MQDFTRQIYDEAGKPLGLLCCMMEHTKEQRSTRLYESLPTAICEVDANGIVIDGNHRLAELLGFKDLSEVKGKGRPQVLCGQRGC